MKKCFHLTFLIPLVFLSTSCGSTKTCYVTVNTNNCTIEGLESSYQSNTEVKAKIKVNDLIYSLPTREMILVNGVSSLNYDESTGDLSFIVNDDVNIVASTESFCGPETNYADIAVRYTSSMRGESTEYIPWTKARFIWDFSSVTSQTDQTILFSKLKTIYGLETTQLSGDQTFTQDVDDIKFGIRPKDYYHEIPILSGDNFILIYPYYPENRYFDAVTPPHIPDYTKSFYIYQTNFSLFFDGGISDTLITYSHPSDDSKYYTSNIKSYLINYDIGGENLINGSFAVEYSLV